MTLRILALTLLVCVACCATALAQLSTDANMSLVVQESGPLKATEHATLLRSLLRVAEPEVVTVERGEDVRDVLRQRCGEARDAEMQIFRELNPRAPLVAAATGAVRLPPCPYVTGRTSVAVPKGSTVADLMHLYMGASGPRSREQVERLNPGVDLDRVAAGQSITLPYSVRSVSVRLRSEWQGAAAVSAAAQIPVRTAIATALRLVQPVTVSTAPGSPCAIASANPRWPFDATRLLTILRQNDAARGAPARPTVAAVADTGIEPAERRLPLERSRSESDNPESDLDGNRHYGDVIGVNLATSKGFPSADPRDADSKHGTHVAALVAGQTMSEALGTLAAATVRLKILNLKSLAAVLPVRDGEPVAVFTIPPDGLRHALTYASDQRASVLNLSVESDVEIPDFRSVLAESPLVTVAAAGNAGLDLDGSETRVYPAAYQPERPEKFITVAAHGPDGKLAPFSNHGRTTVDLAAPGVCIDSFVPGGARERLSGTSQAAPLVSFTAALLASEGLSPATIKRRITHTVDIDRTLPVAAEGRLNVLKAVACYDDQLEVEGRGWLRGRFAPGATVTVNGQATPLASLARLLPRYDSGAPKPMKVFFKGPASIARSSVAAALPAGRIPFEVLGSDQYEEFDLSTIVDVVPRDCEP